MWVALQPSSPSQILQPPLLLATLLLSDSAQHFLTLRHLLPVDQCRREQRRGGGRQQAGRVPQPAAVLERLRYGSKGVKYCTASME